MDSAELRKTKKIKNNKKILMHGIYLILRLVERKWNAFIQTKKITKKHVIFVNLHYHIPDEGFLGCTNNKCGIVYTDMIEQGAEWRYYGADDNSNSDPTRCGMPINPLLTESSFGCKILGGTGGKSWEMRK